MTDIEIKLNHYDMPELNRNKTVHSLIPGINHIDSVGSKPTCRRGISMSVFKDNLSIEQPVIERAKVIRGRESRSSTRKQVSRNNMKQYHSLQKDRSERENLSVALNGSGMHNPITNPLNLYNPYSKNARDQIINESKNYRGGVFNKF